MYFPSPRGFVNMFCSSRGAWLLLQRVKLPDSASAVVKRPIVPPPAAPQSSCSSAAGI